MPGDSVPFDHTYANFEAVRNQPIVELRRLLREGEPVERAWAAWALGQRIGDEANPDLIEAAHDAPTPGVRSLLLVVLAGHGEQELVEAFAKNDPDDEVRASACRYVAMTATPDREHADS
jgi:HEAT repeat protein